MVKTFNIEQRWCILGIQKSFFKNAPAALFIILGLKTCLNKAKNIKFPFKAFTKLNDKSKFTNLLKMSLLLPCFLSVAELHFSAKGCSAHISILK